MTEVKHIRLVTNHLLNMTHPDKFIQQLRPLMEAIVVPGPGMRPGVLFVCKNGAHRAPTGACVALICGGISAALATQHLYKIRRVVDFSTSNKHQGMSIDKSLPPFEPHLLALGLHLHVKATLPFVVAEREFEQVRRRRFFSLPAAWEGPKG